MSAGDLFERLCRFCELPGPAGREELVGAFLAERWGDRLEGLAADRRGNLLGWLGSSGPRLGLVAHMDEIGWVVRHITDDGFLILDTAQGSRRDGPPLRHMVGHEVAVLGRTGVVASGVFAAASGHVLTKEQLERHQLGWTDVFVDLGLAGRAEVEALGVHIGSPVVFVGRPRRIGDRIAGKAMDDRCALCVLDLLLDRLDPEKLGCRLGFAATVHEEGGLHGAHALALHAGFDLAIVLEIGLVGDVPSVGPTEYEARLGGGPTLVHRDGQIAYDHGLTWAIADAADAAGVAVQHAVWANANTDGVPLLRAGIPTALIGIPTRYTHTAFEMVDPGDVEATARLLEAVVTGDALRGLT